MDHHHTYKREDDESNTFLGRGGEVSISNKEWK